MGFELRPATSGSLDFARDLTCRNLLRYYIRHHLLWQDEAFDVAWAARENWIVAREDVALGFVSLSRDAKALYIRELHMLEICRGQGAGSWVIDQVFAMACKERRPALRLTVFNDNPAKTLYERKGLKVVGEDECFLRMQRDIGDLHR